MGISQENISFATELYMHHIGIAISKAPARITQFKY